MLTLVVKAVTRGGGVLGVKTPPEIICNFFS